MDVFKASSEAAQDILGSWRATEVYLNAGVMNFWRRIGHWQRALEIFESMPRARLRVDLVAYLAAFSAYKAAMQWERALSTFEGMEPTALRAYNAVMSVCSAAARWAQALRLMEAMPMSPNEMSFSILMDACERPGYGG